MVVRYFLFVILAHGAYCANHQLFKNCSRTFCSELRNPSLTDNEKYKIINGEITHGVASFILKNENNQILHINISIVNGATTRVKIYDPKQERYQIEHVLVPTLAHDVNRLELTAEESKYSLLASGGTNSGVQITINKGPPFSVQFHNDQENDVTLDGDKFVWKNESGNENFAFDVKFSRAKALYGLFHHADTLALRDTASEGVDPYRLRNSDTSEYEVNSTMALYGSVPVIYGHSVNSTRGIFLHNAAEQWIDTNYNGSSANARFMVHTGSFDLFVFMGPKPKDVVRQYTALTGVAHMPQLWTLGYHQCRWSYYTQDEVKNVIANMDRNDFPMDAIWLDIDYTDGKRYFTWNPVNYTDPIGLQNNISSTNRKLVLILDPHIKVDSNYSVYSKAHKRDLFVKTAKEDEYQASCWPGLAAWLDFLNPATREFYSQLYLYENFTNTTETIAGIWNDMNEPAVFDDSTEKSMPEDALHYGNIQHKNIHNMYGFLQTISTHEGLLKRDNFTKRPFVLTRSHFAGSQRYAAMWTGDNTASWGHLGVSYAECLTANVLGQVWCGADIGGFHNVPDEELVYRWYQAGAWIPFYRGHAEEKQPMREPYVYSEETQKIIRDSLKTRYRHIHVWYTLFYEHAITGDPVIKPLFYNYPRDEAVFNIDNQLLVGNDILVRQIAEPNATIVSVYFPGENQYWYQLNDKTIHQGGTHEFVNVNKSFIPVYYRLGSIIPLKETERRCSEDMKTDLFTLYINLDQNNTASGKLYIDDWTSFKYVTEKEFLYIDLSYKNEKLSVRVIDIDANFKQVAKYFFVDKLIINRFSNETQSVKVDERTHTSDGTPLKEINFVDHFKKDGFAAVQI